MLDYYTDKNGSFIKEYLRTHPTDLSTLEKVANENEEWLEPNSLTKEAFADRDNRALPIFSKTAAMTSALYVKAQADEIPFEVKERVQEACNIYGINTDVFGDSPMQKLASEQVTLSDNDFVFPEKQKLPMVDENTWNMSSDVFMKVAEELSLEDLVIGARRLIKKANELNIEANDELQKLALLDAHISKEDILKEAEYKFFETGDSRYLTIEKTAAERLLDNSYSILSDLIALNRDNKIDNTKSTLLKVASISKDDIISIGSCDLPVEKIANIATDEWKEVLPYEEIASFTDEEGSFDKTAFEHLYQNLTDIEQDIVSGFIQNKI